MTAAGSLPAGPSGPWSRLPGSSRQSPTDKSGEARCGKRVPRSALVSARSFGATPPNPDAPEPASSRQHPHQTNPYLHIVGAAGSGNAEYDPEHAEQFTANADRTPPPHLFPTQSGWGGIRQENHLPRWCARKRRASRTDAPAWLPPQARTPEPARTGPPDATTPRPAVAVTRSGDRAACP